MQRRKGAGKNIPKEYVRRLPLHHHRRGRAWRDVGVPARTDWREVHCSLRCGGGLFGRERPEVVSDFQIHSVNLSEETRRRQSIALRVGFSLSNLRHLLLELADA